METQKKLVRRLNIMIFNITCFLLFLVFLNGCFSRDEDAWNLLVIENKTENDLLLIIRKNDNYPNYHRKDSILARSKYNLNHSLSQSDFDMINENWGSSLDTVEIFCHDSSLIKWGGPLLDLSDSIHSFYNKKSWVISNGGRKDKYIIATFTITDEDFKPEE